MYKQVSTAHTSKTDCAAGAQVGYVFQGLVTYKDHAKLTSQEDAYIHVNTYKNDYMSVDY